MNNLSDLSASAEKSFSFAQETVKQMITLSTAIFALTLTFRKDVVPQGADTTLLEIAWAAYLVSVLFGLCTLMNLAGNIGLANPTINAPGIRMFAVFQSLTFLGALVLTMLFGYDVVV